MRFAKPAIVLTIYSKLYTATERSIQREAGIAHVRNNTRENYVAIDLRHCMVVVFGGSTRLWLARLAAIRQIRSLISVVAFASILSNTLRADTIVTAIVSSALRIALVDLDACRKSILVQAIFEPFLANAQVSVELINTVVAIPACCGELDAPINVAALIVVGPGPIFLAFFMVSGRSSRFTVKRVPWQALVIRSLLVQELSAFGSKWLCIDGVSPSHRGGAAASHRLARVKEIMI